MPVAGLCLAAGGASRLGRPKQLLPWGEATLLQTCVRGLLRAPLSCLTVVLGAKHMRRQIETARLHTENLAEKTSFKFY